MAEVLISTRFLGADLVALSSATQENPRVRSAYLMTLMGH